MTDGHRAPWGTRLPRSPAMSPARAPGAQPSCTTTGLSACACRLGHKALCMWTQGSSQINLLYGLTQALVLSWCIRGQGELNSCFKEVTSFLPSHLHSLLPSFPPSLPSFLFPSLLSSFSPSLSLLPPSFHSTYETVGLINRECGKSSPPSLSVVQTIPISQETGVSEEEDSGR